MLHLITGTPGAGKTLYAVFLIDNYEKANKRALEFNAIALKQNKELIEKNNLQDYFASYTYFSKITKVIYAELSGDFPLGDSRQPIYKSLRPFDLVS
ncbi:hypothetical protein [Acinetobacter baumannii]|uniref:hypothetical protein n=1 Tax=Acinetobacter baumannii TaxID=470 RepID=UPI003891C704